MNRLIDADVLIEKAHQESKGMSYPYREDFGLLVEWIVDKTPVVWPQPEIIRCKECRFRDTEGDEYVCLLDTGDPYALGRNADEDDWFCADAERREEHHEL